MTRFHRAFVVDVSAEKNYKMIKGKKRLTSTQISASKRAKKEKQEKFTWVFMSGKQVRVKRHPQTIDGVDVDQYIEQNADPTWLHQNELWSILISRNHTKEKTKMTKIFLSKLTSAEGLALTIAFNRRGKPRA